SWGWLKHQNGFAKNLWQSRTYRLSLWKKRRLPLKKNPLHRQDLFDRNYSVVIFAMNPLWLL
ncbi:MAG: hypothetical protein ACLU4W_06590, partial [Acutalibacteraceae bacterium]